ncbi:hypothetical protein [Stenotrophomonas sp. NLF4-10]|uniref:hypothetical protein n=1 Tax=Stenotrophomonas sp. NLF4-10 TaxID=2918754 RepID=UPI001EFA6526|nr:hypothetical protein [Stenotrophomonas sp. NLF4-10]MCG8275369.1 hypothetical protein [Stenotrophomonas sp. NLF4-10]
MNAHNEQQGFTAGDIADQGARQFAAGYAAAKAEQHVIEQIAQQWDGCMYDTVGETINIGEAIRAAGKRLSSQPAAAPGIDPHALGLLEVLGAKNFAEASNIVGELLASTPAAPGIDLRQFREAVVAWSDAAYTHSEDSDHPICREADRLLALIDGSPKATTFRNYGDSEAQFIADEAHLNCPARGGSGHVEDSPKGGSEARNAVVVGLIAAAQAAWTCIGELSPTQARVEVAQMLTAAIDAAMQEPAHDAAEDRCESGSPECGPVEHWDSDGVPLCAKCFAKLQAQPVLAGDAEVQP